MQPRVRLALASLSPQTTPLISPLVLVRVAVGPIQTFVDGNMALYDKLMQTTGLDIELWHVTETAIAGMVARQIIPGISFTTAKAAKKAKLGTPPDANWSANAGHAEEEEDCDPQLLLREDQL